MQIVKGKRAVLEALKAEASIERVVVSFAAMDRPDVKPIVHLAHKKSIKVQTLSNQAFQKSISDDQTQGIVAYMGAFRYSELSDIIAHKEDTQLIVALDHIEDPYNFGAILRTCETLGVKSVIFPKDRNAQMTPGTIKASSGAVHHLNLVKVTNIAQSLIQLKKAGFWVYGSIAEEGEALDQVNPAFPMVLVMGNENKGLSKRVTSLLDGRLAIPMSGQVGSLNVSVAAGILIYALSRKR
jgi:23S rRNA (guanosine2251-2'-O)-methyltransferase